MVRLRVMAIFLRLLLRQCEGLRTDQSQYSDLDPGLGVAARLSFVMQILSSTLRRNGARGEFSTCCQNGW